MYELVFTRPDEHATVFEFVNLAKRCGHRGLANLVNAVLRSFLRDRPVEPQRDRFPTEDEYLAVRYSLPTWIVRQWRQLFGDRLEAVCAAVNEPAQGAIAVNRRKTTVEEIAQRLSGSGVAARRSPIVAESLLVDGAPRGLGDDGSWWIQSESAAMPVDVLNPQPGEAVLDVCSGRGNKALQIGGRIEGQGMLLCLERDARKSATLEERLAAGDVVAGIVTGDATADLLSAEQRFDRILVDAPCSGVGVIGRHPEARWKKAPSDGERLAVTQRALLQQAARHVYPGGALVYAVCSTDPRETTEVMDWFLSEHNFERGLVPVAYGPLLTQAGDALVPPGIDGRDGFYIARVERRT